MKGFLLLITLLFAIQVHAGNESQEKIAVLNVIKNYSGAVACSTNFEDGDSLDSYLKNVYTIDRDDESGSATYYVLWSGDMGCMGGSGTYRYFISEVSRHTNTRPFLVQNNEAFGLDIENKINFRFIESVTKINSNHFSIVSSEFADGDSNNFPSLKYKYTIKTKGLRGPWYVTNKTLIK